MGILSGKVVLVTGGANGIGRECVLQAAAHGARVVVNDLGGDLRGDGDGSPLPAETVARFVREQGGDALADGSDITNRGAVADLVERTLRHFGGLHAVINPAGILRDRMFHKLDDLDWNLVLDVHLHGAYNVCRATIEHFREQREGNYVLFTSTSGLIGNLGQANYAAAKLGVVGLSRILALEGAARNIRSNVVAPVAWTRLTGTVSPKTDAEARQLERYRETMRPDQPARLAVALSASTDVSGQIFGAQAEEIEIYSQPRAIETLTADDGWTVDSILDVALPRLKSKFSSLAGLVEESEGRQQNSSPLPVGEKIKRV